MVGSHLLDYLIKNTNDEIHGLIRWRSNLENIEHHINLINKKKEFLHYGDLTDNKSLDEIIKKKTTTCLSSGCTKLSKNKF